MRSIAILGATGSIGTQTLDMVRRYPNLFRANCLAAYSSEEKLFDLVREFRPDTAALVCEPKEIPEDLRFCEWFFGKDACVKALQAAQSQDALCAIVGIAGLDAVWTALDVCERVLLANKEALVTGGNLVMEKAKRLNKPLLPVDSEHSAIFQCLQARANNPVARLHLTASGGALRDYGKEQIQNASVEDVLKHPNWKMGAKITVDCATMVNKGLEVIEAHYLFDMPLEKINVVVHPESVIHSMIEFADGAILAQMGKPDMRGPIGYAMGYPNRLPYDVEPLNFAALASLTFRAPDFERFPGLKMAMDALKAGGSMPVVLNGANEAAVAAFLNRKIPFGAIATTISETLNRCERSEILEIADVAAADARARECAGEILRRF